METGTRRSRGRLGRLQMGIGLALALAGFPALADGGRSLPDGVSTLRRSERTVAVGIEVDRDGARVLNYALKDRPFERAEDPPAARSYEDGVDPQIEVMLLGPAQGSYTARVDLGPLCLSHEPGAPPHVEGDTIRLHRDSFVVELPELPGFDRVEVAYYERGRGGPSRRSLGVVGLSPAAFLPAGSRHSYSDLAFASATMVANPEELATTGAVHWPEEFGDPEIYKLYGNAAETGKRINVAIVPDGYTYAEKSLMQAHADAMVAYFRAKTPYKEHDPFLNYTLVYAYSNQSGTDECDCGSIKDTAMGTRFPNDGYPCLNTGNRCLYYGTGCDTSSSGNITAAELRAPAADKTVVMVNTSRYGGCGGTRAVYSAANSSATEVAVHELGHTLGGLADEYGGTGCGNSAGGVNTSLDAVSGAWAEWVPEIGAPKEGGQYFDHCVYRPQTSCDMRALGYSFCVVCNQRWSLVYFGHFRVAPTAPVESVSPASPLTVEMGVPVLFSAATRLASGTGITNSLTWQLQAPGDPEPVTVASGTASHQHVFSVEGSHVLTLEVVADTNFVKPVKYGSNRDTATWTIQVVRPRPGEVSPPGSVHPQAFTDRETMVWEDAAASGATTFNVYRGDTVGMAAGGYGSCFRSGLASSTTSDAQIPSPGVCFTYLVTGKTSGGEGTMGNTSGGAPRNNGSPCN